MAKVLGDRQTLPLEKVVLAQAFQLEDLLNVLERQGMIKKAEVLEEIKRLREHSVRARYKHHERRASLGARGVCGVDASGSEATPRLVPPPPSRA